MTEPSRAVVNRLVEEVINQRQFDVADEIVAEDFIEQDPLPGQAQGRDGLKQVIAAFVFGFPDLHWTIDEQISEGEKVVSRFTWTGTHQGAFLGMLPTHRRVAVRGVVIDRVVKAQLVESRILMDSLGMVQQLGLVPAPPPDRQ